MRGDERVDCLALLEPWLSDPRVTAIMVNGWREVFVERERELVKVATPFRDDEELVGAIQASAAAAGVEVGAERPIVEVRLGDGSRLNAVMPPVSLIGPTLTIRKVSRDRLSDEELIRLGAWSAEMATFLRAGIRARLNVVVAGSGGSGKTAFLNVLCQMIPAQERIVILEVDDELQLPERYNRLVRLESRPADADGRGEVSMRDLVRNALRMRPDRVVVGEVRGPEAADLLQAMNTGHDGTLLALHANSVRDALARLEMAVLSAHPSMPLLHVRQSLAAAVDLITYQERLSDGSRKVVHVTEVQGIRGDALVLQDLFQFRRTGAMEGRVTGHHAATGAIPRSLSRIRDVVPDLPLSLFTPQ
jgi:pilus assembly protein CpaF